MAGRALLRARAWHQRGRASGGAPLTARSRARLGIPALGLALLAGPIGFGAHAAPPERLGGWVAVSDSLAQAWPTAVAFVYPVGDPHDFARAESAHAGYTLLRGVSAAHDSTPPHQGVDLGNGSRGGIVRAAASGIVVRGRGDDWQDGYGYYVTLAHRLPDGSLIYTVYAHLAKGSVRPAAGRVVKAGQPLGRVGRTGRATTAHLHFEVRRCTDPGERWEKAPVEDPLVFLHEHIATREATTAGP